MATKKNVPAPVVAPEVVSLEVGLICPNPKNPRKRLGDVKELAASIEAQGIRQNLLVVPHPEISGQYLLVIGHRRLAAAKLAGLTHVPAVIDGSLSVSDQLVLMGVENVHRSDLTISEEADWLQGLLDLGEISKTALPKATGLSRKVVASRLVVAGLPDRAKVQFDRGAITLEDVTRVEGAREFLTEAEYEKALRLLGDRSARWEIPNLIAIGKARRERAEAVVTCREAGFEVVEDGSVARDRGYGFVGTTRAIQPVEGDVLVEPDYGSHLEVYRRSSVQADPEEAAARLEEIRLEEERRVALSTSTELRHAFVLELTRGTRKPSSLEDVVALVREAFLVELFDHLEVYPDYAAEWLMPDVEGLQSWELSTRVASVASTVTDFRWMLAVLAAHAEGTVPGGESAVPGRPSSWLSAGSTWGDRVRDQPWRRSIWQRTARWLHLLAALGYDPTPFEVEQLQSLRAVLADLEAGEQ